MKYLTASVQTNGMFVSYFKCKYFNSDSGFDCGVHVLYIMHKLVQVGRIGVAEFERYLVNLNFEESVVSSWRYELFSMLESMSESSKVKRRRRTVKNDLEFKVKYPEKGRERRRSSL